MSGPADWPWPDFLPFIDEVRTELVSGTERGAILICASMLDEQLARLIATRLIDHKVANKLLGYEGEAPLSSFSSRIDAAFALGLINSPEHSALHILRKVRNECAHSVKFKLSDEAWTKRVRAFTAALVINADNLALLSTLEMLVHTSIDLMLNINNRIRNPNFKRTDQMVGPLG